MALNALNYRVRVELVQQNLAVLSSKNQVAVAGQDGNRQHISLIQTLLALNLDVVLLLVLEEITRPHLDAIEAVGGKKLVVCGHRHSTNRHLVARQRPVLTLWCCHRLARLRLQVDQVLVASV
jgi:hypothetical protein